jgi:hypothetical protein
VVDGIGACGFLEEDVNLADARALANKVVMALPQMSLIVLEESFAICKLAGDATIPPWATASDFFSITRTAEELSIVCRQDAVPDDLPSERGWRWLRVAGTMPFSVIGVLASLTAPLAEAGISIFAISTFDTDYLLVRENDLAAAVDALRGQGHTIQQRKF